jgi:hypothetical protein
MDYAITPILIVGLVCFTIFVIGCKVKEEEQEPIADWAVPAWAVIKQVMLAVTLVALLCTIGRLPKILLKANIDRVKINYTSPQAIKQIESGALKVVTKLDKLIDKSIKSIDNEDK